MQGLWGGEGIIKGFQEPPPTKHNPNYNPAQETYYWPKLFLGVVYSEVLDKHMEVIMTARGQRMIDESFGLDYYLLKTPVNEVYSHLGMKIKREILLKLAEWVESGGNEKMAAKYVQWWVIKLKGKQFFFDIIIHIERMYLLGIFAYYCLSTSVLGSV